MMFFKKRGRRGAVILTVIAFAISVYAQGEDKFKLYGFADMTINKSFPKEKSWMRSIDKVDEKTYFSLDHFNLYTNFQPNSKLRFLAELSFQDKPVDYLSQGGMRIQMPQLLYDSIWTMPVQAKKNKVQKGIFIYDWGSFSVERALFSISLNRYFNFSFGKFITPAGIWNVDHGSPVIMTVNQPSQYSHAMIYPKSQLGIMEEGKVFMGDADLSYAVYLSSGRENQALYKPEDISVGGQLRLSLPGLNEFNVGFSGYTGKVNTKERWTNMVMTSQDFINWSTDTKFEDTDLIVYRENVIGGDLRLSNWNATIQAELNYQYLTNFLLNKNSKTLATYVIGSYDLLKKDAARITPYAYYEFVKYYSPLNDPTKDPTSVTEGYHKFMGGVNFRFFTNYGIKLEYNFTRINMAAPDPEKLNDCPGISSQFYIAF